MEEHQVHQLYLQINNLFEEFKIDHEKHYMKDNKSAGSRARKSLGELKKLITVYRKSSVAYSEALTESKG